MFSVADRLGIEVDEVMLEKIQSLEFCSLAKQAEATNTTVGKKK